MTSINGKPGAVVIDGHVQGLAITRSLGEKGIPVLIVETKSEAFYVQNMNPRLQRISTHNLI